MTQSWLRQGFSLRLTLVLFLVFPLLALLGLASFSGLRGLENRVELQMQKDIELIARAIRGPLEHALEFDRQRSLDRTLSSAFRFSEVYGVYVYDREGRQVAASGPAEPEVQRRELVQLAADGDRLGAYDEADGEEVYSYFVPLSDSVGRNLGLLQLTRDGSQFKAYITQARHQAMLLLSLLSLSLLALVIFAHHRIIGTPLTGLVESMARIAAGERRHRAVPRGPTEIRQLAVGMNRMLDSLAENEAQLARQQSEQRQLEERLRQSEKMAAIGGLAAGVAHELGTPLSLVAGKAQRMLRRQQSPENAAAFQEIRQAVERMSHIVRQLLDFGRNNQPRRKLVDPEIIAGNAAAQVRDEAEAAGVKIKLEDSQPPPRLRLDPIRLEQALVNLLRNAIQACQAGGAASPLVRLRWFTDDQQAGFQVEDNGPGIAKELYSRLFEPFFTTKEVGRGTGLGLAVVHSAVQDHGGSITVDRSDSGGACFTIYLAKE
ncbi:sensor histidine kinase [Desulfurivibrio alkaliphilus]|uniref:histidine kinase n=1 Tax=Desulfurivibrio alkaliphilus (strain DSM 19089 / UNIQEM U267 / AHT2) TaxID=589865 RepID=D6Z4S6_DESAT|nr:ATP-binding protein [Desulfurivibrio alkaliphilus]ADH86551.1 integral membrane sensor signal transduction histidine kinase [Desulfurivibrio alkaliphilus AHT 2]